MHLPGVVLGHVFFEGSEILVSLTASLNLDGRLVAAGFVDDVSVLPLHPELLEDLSDVVCNVDTALHDPLILSIYYNRLVLFAFKSVLS